ncbi:Mn-dependent DtxR family transcriptional regulator [Brevundimonas alba]|uniref:Mn-dependent DtxR family transcriptional regulator n=1 Tax=Brevundimonas alba TaxID=74314 RepID=A0A7X5YIJ1_9CAUL|nr:hypothetical protein [Brevundimonas alba]NJC40408.1 Mn-dependent DtxR family transcriptional regulator [Brevundimonas alba]
MSGPDHEALRALAWMVEQYLSTGEELDTLSMSPRQDALTVLKREGLVDYDGVRCGSWTEAGRRLLDER